MHVRSTEHGKMTRFIKDNWFTKYYRKDGIRETSITMIAASSID